MSRKEELMKACEKLNGGTKAGIERIIDEMIFLEKRLEELKKEKFLSINPRNPAQQKQTNAAKQYKEFLQQYNNCVKIYLGVTKHSEDDTESPIRQYFEKILQNKK